MSSPVISVRGLGKKYRLGETIRHDTLRDKIAHSLKSLFARKVKCESRNANRETNPQSAIPNCPPIRTPHSALRNRELSPAPQSALHVPQLPSVSPAPRSEFRVPSSADFWALKDVSFDVQQGEVVGIIGRNGAGKSTLLKILSQITEPTEGEIRMRGRVASLLEVGTGFHPELTGGENIFLNGAILGMARSDIRKRFDEIVAFAEVEKFIDTPVKRYSSGMYVRLAFAVAAHLEPEILIVDEVLAVGDAQFQKKCLGKMQEVSKGQGRTVLFVSHNMNAIESLCLRIAHLSHGQLITITNDLRGAIASYLSGPETTHAIEWCNPGDGLPNPWFRPLRFYLGDEQGKLAKMPVRNDHPVYVWIEGEIEQEDVALNVGYALYDDAGMLLYWSAHTDVAENLWPRVTQGRNILRSQIPPRVLNQGKYRLELIVALYYRQWISYPGSNAPAIELSIQGGLSDSPYWMEKRPGLLAPVCIWTLEKN